MNGHILRENQCNWRQNKRRKEEKQERVTTGPLTVGWMKKPRVQEAHHSFNFRQLKNFVATCLWLLHQHIGNNTPFRRQSDTLRYSCTPTAPPAVHSSADSGSSPYKYWAVHYKRWKHFLRSHMSLILSTSSYMHSSHLDRSRAWLQVIFCTTFDICDTASLSAVNCTSRQLGRLTIK